MTNLVTGTDYVRGDEYAINLAETNLISPEDHQWHRFEIILLYRDGCLVEYRRDMGLKDDSLPIIRVMGGVVEANRIYQEETIASLREHADDMRWNKQFDWKEIPALNKWQDKHKLNPFVI